MPGKVRRIVTAVNAAGRSYILSDTSLPAAPVAPGEPVRAGLWVTESAPASNEGVRDPVPDGVIFRIPPVHRGGTVLRVVEFVPDSVQRADPRELARRGAKTTPDRSAKDPGFAPERSVLPSPSPTCKGLTWTRCRVGWALRNSGGFGTR